MRDDLFSYGNRGIRDFVKRNIVAILYTLIFHVLVLIVLVLVKVEGLKQDRELGVVIDFTEEEPEIPEEEETVEVPAEFMEQVYAARERASNRAVNLDDRLNKEISTEDYVDELKNELESQRDEEFLKNREKWEEILSTAVTEQEDNQTTGQEETEEEEEPFTGPTTITYKFLEKPEQRGKINFTIPVYRCEGSGEVVVDIEVARDGRVVSADVASVKSGTDSNCFSEAAVRAALSSRFHSDFDAPKKHRAQITYQFIAQ